LGSERIIKIARNRLRNQSLFDLFEDLALSASMPPNDDL
jgi:hypothetical protein